MQSTQELAPLEGFAFPAGQSRHAASSLREVSGLYFPLPQERQAVAEAMRLAYLPGVHERHSPLSATLTVPGGQEEHTAEALAAKRPAGQPMQVPLVRALPASQGRHSESGMTRLYTSKVAQLFSDPTVPHSPSPSHNPSMLTVEQSAMSASLGHSLESSATKQNPQSDPASHEIVAVSS
jgi:hypothetical protein